MSKSKRNGRRLVAALVCLMVCLMTIPFSTANAEEQTVYAYYGERYVGYDGGNYVAPEYDYIAYDENGNVSFHTSLGRHMRIKLMMRAPDGSTRQVLCIESGVGYGADKNYTNIEGEKSQYFQNLPMIVQYGILLTSIYGWQPGKTAPVEETNEDDYAMATQTIIWEYQQQLRISPTELLDTNDWGIKGDIYYNCIKDRPAEKCYNWILSQMQQHNTIPSFSTNSSADAQTLTLKYNQQTNDYRLTVTDTNNVLSDIKIVGNDDISVDCDGNSYTFISKKMIDNPVTIQFQKTIANNGESFLIWNCAGAQTVMSGIKDPLFFYTKIQTETDGTAHVVKNSEDNNIAEIDFRIQGNGIDEIITTGADGTVDISLLPGIYEITEMTDNIYVPQNTRRITIVSGGTSTVIFDNALKRGSLTVTKTSEDGLNEDVAFRLSGTSLSGLAVDEYAVTDSSGVARFDDVLIGTGYVLEEVDTAVRYVVPENQTAAVEWNTVTNKSFTNILKKWNVVVTKSDRETGFPQGDATLAGATYGIYKGEQLIDTYTTDENGQFVTKYYVCGDDWSLREIEPSEGYLLDESVHHIGAEAKNYTVEYSAIASDVGEQIIKGRIALIKHTDNGDTGLETPEVGAEFEVYLKKSGSYGNTKETERDYLVCDENGFAQTKDLPYGIYTVHQVKGWDGRELLADFDVYIAKNGEVYHYLANNANFESYIKIIKVDAETGKIIPYAGAGFQLYRPDETLITQSFTYPEPAAIDTFYTNDEGYLITPEKLEYGTGYSLVEVFAPYGYVLNSEPVYFDVVQNASTDEGSIAVIEVIKENTAQKGIIKIGKTGEVFSSVTESEGVYQPVYSVQGLAGAVYEITAAEDIYTLDGTLRYTAGEVIDTVTTDNTGLSESKPLYLGKYEIREITAPNGMVLNGEVHIAELTYAGQEIEITETAASFYNERQKAAVTLDKILEQNEQFGIGANGEITAVTFGLFAAEDVLAADGSVIPADGLLEILSVDESGHAVCKTDLPLGSFYFKELSTDEHYILSDEKYPFEFSYMGQNTVIVEIKANDGTAISNDLIYGEIHGLKKDENGNALGGAVIGLFNPDCTEFITENAIMTAISAEDGSFSFAGVPYGNWVVREIEAPTGFVLSEESFAVTIDKDGAIIEVEIENTLIRGNVQVTKTDKDYPENKLTGAEFTVYRDSNGNGELDADDETLGTLTETSTGVYEMPDLTYGGYFVKETKAPEGFYLDENAYPFEISEHGKTVTVENEAGTGFVNTPQVGSLKIVKSSSDGKVEGFSFRVTGSNGYSEVFVTNENGEILIENLRIGDYTVSEVSDGASAAYVLPADKTASVFEGSVTTVEMHNEFRINPDTGDNQNLTFWFSLFAISAISIVIIYVKKRKYEKEDIK